MNKNTGQIRLEWRLLLLLGMAATMASCARGFRTEDFATPEALFRGTMQEFERHKWDNAQTGFERLASDLSSRDPLLATVYYYLALTHEHKHEFLLAAQAFERVTDGFPDDTLAPMAMLGSGRSYQSMWRRPALDPEYGQRAVAVLRSLMSSYPEATKEVDEAADRIAVMEEWFAQKDYDTGVHYLRVRKAIDPAIIYFKDVVTTYPGTKAARLSWLRLHELYTKIRWREDAAETCTAMWNAYPGDPEVVDACGAAPKDSAAVPPTSADSLMIEPLALRSPAMLARPAPATAGKH